MLHRAGTRIGQWTRRPRRAIRRLSERTPLRVKLITALLALVIIALGAIGVASVYVLHSYLTAQSDTELKGALSRLDTDSLISNPPGYLYPVRVPAESVRGNPAAGEPARLALRRYAQHRHSRAAAAIAPGSAHERELGGDQPGPGNRPGAVRQRHLARDRRDLHLPDRLQHGQHAAGDGHPRRRHGSRQHRRHGPPHRLLRHDRGRRYRVRPGDGGRRGGAGQPETPGRDRGDRGGHCRRPS